MKTIIKIITNINLKEINEILSKTLIDVVERKVSLKQADMIAKLATALSKNISNTELEDRIQLLERVLKERI